MNQPTITVSSLDLERIERLLEQAGRDEHQPLRRELERAEVREPEEMPADVITMNSTALFVDEDSGTKREMTLAYPRDADGASGRVSILAPVGSALLGLAVGQRIDWPAPSGGKPLRLRVLAIRYQPEAAGAYHR
ncbi:MAG: nucleoside diphosphate kinase regulator [Chromatiales bacterium]|jgi:regulator of nucleoside diphosphate kinase|nr:nucleoside diphosphate kinase regulator [Chromatiales bacterium]MDX9768395.1 nucleoside diphosphate kinase regulator [Ectothiorhodospiraceae bacterium]